MTVSNELIDSLLADFKKSEDLSGDQVRDECPCSLKSASQYATNKGEDR